MPIIDTENLRAALPAELQSVLISCVEHTGSTNTDLLDVVRKLPSSYRTPILLQADVQSAGRGRLGRHWANQAGASLMFSLAWPFETPIRFLSGLSLVCGLACAHALSTDLNTSQAQRIKLKWPNDLLLDNKKLGGILVETVNKQSHCWAVIGIGLNYKAHDEVIAHLNHPVATLDSLRSDLDHLYLLAQLVTTLAQQLRIFETLGFIAFKNDWQHFDAYYGKPVVIYENEKCIEQGVAAGVDDTGQLLLNTANGLKQILAGEVSLRCNSI